MVTAMYQQLAKRIDSYKDEMIEMQKKLISIVAIAPSSGGKGEYQKGRYLEAHMEELFDEIKCCHAKDPTAEGGIRPNYAAIMKGKDRSRTIWFMGHMDVVPEGDIKLWNTPPFEAVVKDGNIYGRGSEDNNQAIVSSFFAIKAMKDEGIEPPCNLGLLLVSDEETGNDLGVIHVLQNHKDYFGKNDSMIVPDYGDKEGLGVEVAEKSVMWVRITTHGKQSHGAFPARGLNAHVVGAHIIVKLRELYNRFDAKDPLFEPQPQSTFEATQKLANVPNTNTIPAEDIVHFDCRLLPNLAIDDAMKVIREMANEVAAKFGATVDVEAFHTAQAAKPTPLDAPIVKAVLEAAKHVYDVDARPIGIGGNTVGQNFRQEGFPCAIYSKLAMTLHGPNEYCVIDNMIGDTKVWARTILNMK